MPRGRIKEIVRTARFEQASLRGQGRICKGNKAKHRIEPGSWCLTVKDGLIEKSYCPVCARAILERGHLKLNTLFDELERVEGKE